VLTDRGGKSVDDYHNNNNKWIGSYADKARLTRRAFSSYAVLELSGGLRVKVWVVVWRDVILFFFFFFLTRGLVVIEARESGFPNTLAARDWRHFDPDAILILCRAVDVNLCLVFIFPS
jgi:hypothetical protein